MGKPVKITDNNKSWNRKSNLTRRSAFRPVRKRILIVCEGTKTEPNYFEAIRALLPPHTASLDIMGEGANTLSLVGRAQVLRDEKAQTDYPYDKVWVVFDRDSFEADDFDNAIGSAENDEMECAWSNEAFELWYLLHFEYRNTGMQRTEYQGRLDSYLGERYRKNATDMYEKLSRLGKQQQAIANAKRLFEDAENRYIPPSKANPCTKVYKLVEELNEYLPEL